MGSSGHGGLGCGGPIEYDDSDVVSKPPSECSVEGNGLQSSICRAQGPSTVLYAQSENGCEAVHEPEVCLRAEEMCECKTAVLDD